MITLVLHRWGLVDPLLVAVQSRWRLPTTHFPFRNRLHCQIDRITAIPLVEHQHSRNTTIPLLHWIAAVNVRNDTLPTIPFFDTKLAII